MNKVWDFFHADEHQSFRQGDTTILRGCGQASLDSQSNCKILKREISLKGFDGFLDFLLDEDPHQSC